MDITEIVLLAIALAMDATIYAFSYGLMLKKKRMRSSLQLGITVGAFQAGMPLAGYLCGHELKAYVQAAAPLLVLLIFCILGAYIIYGAWTTKEDATNSTTHAEPLRLIGLLLVGLATAIDALIVGMGMALGNIGGEVYSPGILLAEVSIIGMITFAGAMAAFHAAKALHHLPTRGLETTAGILLIALGVHATL